MADDWRLDNLRSDESLIGIPLQRRRYRAYREGWDHDHCCGCWVTLSEPGQGDEDAVHEGYATCSEYRLGAEYHWVCVQCFDEFATKMGWRSVPPEPGERRGVEPPPLF